MKDKALPAHKDDWHIAWHLGMEIKCLLLFFFRRPGESLNHGGDSAACVSIAPHCYFTRQSFDSVGKQEIKPLLSVWTQAVNVLFLKDQSRGSTEKEAVCIIVSQEKEQRDNEADISIQDGNVIYFNFWKSLGQLANKAVLMRVPYDQENKLVNSM